MHYYCGACERNTELSGKSSTKSGVSRLGLIVLTLQSRRQPASETNDSAFCRQDRGRPFSLASRIKITGHGRQPLGRENSHPTSSLMNWQDNPYHCPLTGRALDADIASTLADYLPGTEEPPVTRRHASFPDPEGRDQKHGLVLQTKYRGLHSGKRSPRTREAGACLSSQFQRRLNHRSRFAEGWRTRHSSAAVELRAPGEAGGPILQP